MKHGRLSYLLHVIKLCAAGDSHAGLVTYFEMANQEDGIIFHIPWYGIDTLGTTMQIPWQ